MNTGTSRLLDQNEDAATLAFANLMRSNRNVLSAFLALVAPEIPKRDTWAVLPQRRTKFGRKMDIFIRSTIDDFSIVVEAKIRDAMKPYQFDAYVQHVISFETGRRPLLVWLVQRPRSVIGYNAAQARIVTWNELHRTLAELSAPDVVQFCDDLVSCGIVLPKAAIVKRQTYKGCKAEHALAILRNVRDFFQGLQGDVEEGSRTPLSLHVGRRNWNLYWNRRVWFYFEPTTQQRDVLAPYGFVCHLLLYHALYDTFDPRRIEHWSKTMVKFGLEFRRNVHGKWNYGCDAFAPLRLTSKTGLNYLFARRADELLRDFDWQDDASAVATGRTYLQWGLEMFDACLQDPN
jgi:hypothetical protein